VRRIIVTHFPKEAREDSMRNRISPVSIDLVDIHFTASTAFAEKLKKAVARLSHKYPKGGFESIFNEALDALFRECTPKPRKAKAVLEQSPTASRYIRQSIRRDVRESSHEQCSYVSQTGKRCEETHFLELDHIYPWAVGGANTADNLRVFFC
jgi:hypothetical protein